jgi:hypothetical protein
LGLDIYVGSLSRYCSQEWESALEQMSRRLGVPSLTDRPQRTESPRPPQEARTRSLLWRDRLNAALREHLEVPLGWNEAPDAPYFTDHPGWDGWCALLLWAAYAEHPRLTVPQDIPTRWADDPAYASSHDPQSGFRTSFPNLLMEAELWLPGDFNLLCETRSPATGKSIVVGSGTRLVHELCDLNSRTWKAPSIRLSEWASEGPPRRGRQLESWARFGFSLIDQLCRLSGKHRLPMLLDY